MCSLAWIALLVAAQPARIAVFDIAAKAGISADQRDIFNELIQHEVRALGHTVIGKSDMEATLGFDRMRASMGCDSSSCWAELGGALGVDEIVTGALARMAPYLVITLKRINPKDGSVIRQAVRKIESDTQKQLVDAAQPIIAELFSALSQTPAPTSQNGDAELRLFTDDSRVFDVTVSVDGRTLPCKGGITRGQPCELRVPPGRVAVTVADYFTDEIHVRPGAKTIYQVRYRSKHLYWVPGTLTLATAGFAVMAGLGARNKQDDTLLFFGASFTGIFGATALVMWIVTPIIVGNASRTRYETTAMPSLGITPMPGGGVFASAAWQL